MRVEKEVSHHYAIPAPMQMLIPVPVKQVHRYLHLFFYNTTDLEIRKSIGKCVFLLGCQTQSESRCHFVGFFIFRVGKSLACHSPAKWCLYA